ncbi:hypothetical protein HN385_03895 [archaeon]|jgi:hypothetical protein|nr:hypothetical protein [archaeon]MBT3450891.1 hypothetical protein [archaeon]MBT6869073.1 hypothetical protein [archaeon]MBT7193316.1 hypothetical protein [archaeon]MBT7380324.1 hypothetical protein [archaeon]
MKLKNKKTSAFMLVALLVLSVLTPAMVSADDTGLLFFWVDSPTDTSLEVSQGDNLQVEYISWASDDYDLDVTIYDSTGADVSSGVLSGTTALTSYTDVADNVLDMNTNSLSGDYTIVATIVSGSVNDEIILYLAVNEIINNVPEFVSTPPTDVDEHDTYEYEVEVYDADCDEVTLEEYLFPSWASLSSESYDASTCITTATVTGTAPESSGLPEDDWDFIIKGTDEDGNIVYDQWIVRVNDLDSTSSDSSSIGLLLYWLVDADGDGIWDDASTDAQEIDYCDGEVSFEYVAWSSEGFDLEVELNDGGVLVDTLVTDGNSTGTMINDYMTVDATFFTNGAGSYTVEATVTTDSGDTETVELDITVIGIDTDGDGYGDACDTPVLDYIDDQEVDEGELLSFDIGVEDPNGDALTFTVLLESGVSEDLVELSGEAVLITDNSDGTATIMLQPTYTFVTHPDTERDFDITLQVTDDSATVEETFTVTVNDVNLESVIESTPTTAATEGVEYTYEIVASDSDDEDLLQYGLVTGPSDMSLDDTTLSWTPDYDTYTDGDVIEVEISVLDYVDTWTGTEVTQDWEITITNTNRAPEFDSLEDQSVSEGNELTFTVSASDVDSDTLTITGTDLPGAAALIDNGDGTADFEWQTDYDDAEDSPYYVTFTVTDSGSPNLEDTMTIEIEVTETNQAPELTVPGDQEIDEGEELSFTIEATDGDGDELSFTAEDLPEGASLVYEESATTATFTWQTDYYDAGDYEVTFIVSDGQEEVSDVVVITVNNVNQAPDMSLEDQVAYEGTTLEYTFEAADPDDDEFSIVFAEEYYDVELSDNSDGTWTFTWEIDYYQGSESGDDHSFELIAEDDTGLSTQDSFTITVYDVNSAPIFMSEPDTTAYVDDEYLYQIVVDDPEGEEITLWFDGPDGMEMDEDGMVSWTPEWRGNFDVTIYASDGVYTSTQSYTIFVTELSSNLKYSNVMFDDEVASAGDEVRLSVGLNNDGEKDLEDLEISIVVYELGIKYSSGNFDIDSNDQLSEVITMEIPESANEGIYDIRITVSNDDFSHVTHRTLRLV